MANVFEGVWNALKHPLDEAQFLFDVGRGKIDLKDAPGEHQRMMNKTTVPILGDNKIAKNSDAIAGTVIGAALAAPTLMGGGASSGGSWWSSALDSLNAPTDDVLAALADEEGYRALNGITEATPEHTKAWNDVLNSNFGSKLGGALKGLGNMAPREKPQQMTSMSGGGGRRGGGTQIQTQDQYADAMKALVDKYGQFMFNKDF